IEGSPCIAGDLVVAGAGAVEQGADHRPRGDANGHGHPGFVVGVRVSDGQEVFRAAVNDPEGSPLLSAGICYVGSGLNGSAVVALRTLSDADLDKAAQPRVLWRTATPFPATGAVTLAGDALLVGCGNGDFVLAAEHPEGRVIALDKTTGAVRWQAPMPDAVLGPIAVSGTVAIVPVRSGEVVAIDLAAQGRVLWRARVNKSAPVLAGAAFAGALVYAVSNDGYLVVLDAADGRQLEKVYLNAPGRPGELGLSTSSPLVVDGRLYVGSETGGLRCFSGSAP
ncbi:MAG: PQQ-binding-like beta-propeller repeat protein, partial [Planctomycetes bacterium]|nr:PQQ-binding-like beta-propeller repeat protein [Planctomycetota bacterium]